MPQLYALMFKNQSLVSERQGDEDNARKKHWPWLMQH